MEVAASTPRIHLLIATAERASQAGDPEPALRLLRSAARRCWWSDPGRELRERVVAAAERLPVPELHPDLVYTLAAATPVERAATVLARLERLERQGGYDFLAAATLGTAATIANAYAYDHATGFLLHAAAGLRAQGRLGLLAHTLVSLAFSTVHTVDRETGLPAVAEAMRLAEDDAQSRWLTGARIAKARFAALHGDLDTALSVIDEAERQGLAVANLSNLAFIQITRGLIGLAAGNHAEAFHSVWRVFDPTDPAYHPFLQTIAIAELAEAATGDDRRAMARAALQQLDASAGSSEAQLIRINLGFARALLSDDEHAEECFRSALDLDMSRAPFARARLMLAYGAWTASPRDGSPRLAPDRPRVLRGPRCGALVRTRPPGTPLGGRGQQASKPYRLGPADTPRAADRPARRGRPLQQGDRPGTVSVTANDRRAPVPHLPEAQDHLSRPAEGQAERELSMTLGYGRDRTRLRGFGDARFPLDQGQPAASGAGH